LQSKNDAAHTRHPCVTIRRSANPDENFTAQQKSEASQTLTTLPHHNPLPDSRGS